MRGGRVKGKDEKGGKRESKGGQIKEKSCLNVTKRIGSGEEREKRGKRYILYIEREG